MHVGRVGATALGIAAHCVTVIIVIVTVRHVDRRLNGRHEGGRLEVEAIVSLMSVYALNEHDCQSMCSYIEQTTQIQHSL